MTEISDLSLAIRRPRRENRRLPLRFQNEQPVPLASLPPTIEHIPVHSILNAPPSSSLQEINKHQRQLWKSQPNVFGLFRQYNALALPSHDPDAEAQISDVPNSGEKQTSTSSLLFFPYPNRSAFLLGEWYWNDGVQKTKEGFKRLMNIVCDKSFSPADLRGIPWDSLNKTLAECPNSEDMWLDEPDAGWMETSITLEIPFHRNAASPGLHQYKFPQFRHRSIVSVLKEKMANPHDFQHFHLEPYELHWHRKGMPNTESTRVHGELYSSPAFLEAHEAIHTADGEPGCSLPRVLIGLMFGSDSTHLTSFGSASLWPCYMYFGNESKYRRCKPTCNLCNHIAYFQKVWFGLHNYIYAKSVLFKQLPPDFQDFAASHLKGKSPSMPFMAHCQREFLHAQWRELLDNEFLEAYEHGVVIKCCDGVKRRFYFRIFAYSADYPEKSVLNSNAKFLCVSDNLKILGYC